jgi:hypothetical protein
MRLISAVFAATFLTFLLPATHASAFTIDPASGTNSDGTPRFVDPDEQVHSSFGGSNLNEDGWVDRNAVSPRLAPSTDAPNQGVTFPHLFFPTPNR